MANEKVLSLEVGSLQSNCYIVYPPDGGAALVIDPGAEAGRISETLSGLNLTCGVIALTHGHYDHIGGVNELRELYPDAKLAVHKDEVEMLLQPTLNLSWFFDEKIRIENPDILVEDGTTVECGTLSAEILSIAGHSKGGIALYFPGEPGTVFSGDSLFCRSVGRTDLPGGCMETLVREIGQKLLALPEETVVYPGHGPCTTIRDERAENPFV